MPAPVLMRRMLPAGDPAAVAEIVEGWGLWERAAGPAPRRPRVMLNMISTADGRATLSGRSGPLSARADRALFHELRLAADAVLVGAGTIRAEGYGRLIREPSRRAVREQRGLPPEPLAAIVSASLRIDPSIPLLAEREARVVILTPSNGELTGAAAQLDYVRAAREGTLDLTAALGELSARFGVQALLCEGGPHLALELLAAGLLDELFLSVSPRLAGGEPDDRPILRILAGPELEPTVELELLAALENESHLFLRYGVVAPERVSRETIESSSLAR